MNENELYKELGVLTKDKSCWEESIPYVASLLDHTSEKIATNTPDIYEKHMEKFAKLLSDEVDQVRMEARERSKQLAWRNSWTGGAYEAGNGETGDPGSEADGRGCVRADGCRRKSGGEHRV
ncbi:MAG: hypothetical protein IKS10_02460 [Lachnospiraceae bacterium]|nr:hypothetical protein [Lachnospiraceae bacterium]